MYSRRRFIQTSVALGAGAALPFEVVSAVETGLRFEPESPLIPAPRDPAAWPEFRKRLAAWREEKRRSLNYSDALYQRPEFAWVQRCFACCFLMLGDEVFFDPVRGGFRVKAFLESGRREFGGFDAVVLWHAYPRIGFDERNQFDFYRDLPGGLAGLRRAVRALHARGVKVFIDYNPWDTGTRREGGSDLEALVEIVRGMEADGIFLDTMDQGAAGFRAQLDAARPGVVLESEGALPLERVGDHHLSWAQWFADSEAPGVLRNKWFERRHLQHQIKRWDRDHSGELHTAWMNGSGMMIWENIFGAWVGWNARDRSLLRAMLPIQRRFADLFAGEHWTPLVPTEHPEVYASEWSDGNVRLWTLVNRSEKCVEGELLKVAAKGERFFDLIAGMEMTSKVHGLPAEEACKRDSAGFPTCCIADFPIGKALETPDAKRVGKPAIQQTEKSALRTTGDVSGLSPALENNCVVLSGSIPPRGIGCFAAVRTSASLGASWRAFRASQRAVDRRADWDTRFPDRRTVLRPVRATKKWPHALAGMVEIPAARFTMTVEFRVRECGFYESSDERGLVGGDLNQSRQFTREVSLPRYAMDETPVTNAEYFDFLKSSRYRPRHPENFLRHWINGAPPVGREAHPVVYVDLEDTRAYARWAGKRLPTEEEWQFAAEGPEHRQFPWGDAMRADACNDGHTGATTAVKDFPAGRSAFGGYDLCGNVWHWTESERSDRRTRFCILKGGSCFKAQGSMWYADGGPVPCRFAAKFLLMWPGLDRCSTVGFRCVTDLVER